MKRIVVMGASAGGIDAIPAVMTGLHSDLPAAVLIVQHQSQGWKSRFSEIISRHCTMDVRVAEDGIPIMAGVVYVAVPGRHLLVNNGRLALGDGEPVRHVRPSLDVLFISAAEALGSRVIGVVLTGSGRDGAEGCRRIKAKGGVTIAQDTETSLFFDMPEAAVKAGSVDFVLPLQAISSKIVELIQGI